MRRGLLVGCAVAFAAVGIAIALNHDADTPGPTTRLRDALGDRLRPTDIAAGASLFGRCAACHSIGRGGVDLDGPNLYDVVGHAVAQRRPRYAYSAALRRVGGIWTVSRLDAWLTKPATFAPGTTMTFAGLPDAQDRADVIAFLDTQAPGAPLP